MLQMMMMLTVMKKKTTKKKDNHDDHYDHDNDDDDGDDNGDDDDKDENDVRTVCPLTDPEKKAFQGWYIDPNTLASRNAAALVTVCFTLSGVPE